MMSALPTHAAFISEIDLGGPAGQGIEFSQVDPTTDYTLLIMEGGASSLFGFVLDVIHLPAGTGLAGVAMVTDQAWPDNTAQTTTLASLSPASGDTTLALGSTRLLVVMEGLSTVERFDKPLADAAALARYNATELTDYLVLGHGDFASDYQNVSYPITTINATLGIDLLSRTVDKDVGRVIARTNLPNEPIDLDTFYVGDPDSSQQFDIQSEQSEFFYTYTPSMSNLPLTPHTPEPSSLALLALASGLCLCRPRRGNRVA